MSQASHSPVHCIPYCLLMVFAPLASISQSLGDELPRRILLGTQVQPVSEEVKQRLKLRSARGVEVVAVVPDTTASQAGIQKGDVILALDRKNIADPAAFVDFVSTLRTGTELEIRLNRNGVEMNLNANPKELPRETSSDLEMEYAFVVSKVGRLRTVLSMPLAKQNGQKLPAFVLLSGLGNGPSEHPSADPLGLKGIAYELNKLGFAVLRVDKPGCGDSDGGPAKNVDFESVVDGYVAGVRELKKHPRIDDSLIFLFGASMGGLQAPLVAMKEPVRGIAVFGAHSLNWREYMQASTRKQMLLSGVGAGEIEKTTALQSAGWHYLSHEKRAPDDIAEKHPELVDWVEQNWVDGKYFSGIHFQFFQQLCQTNIAEAWEKFDGSVLSMWGESDFVTLETDHQFLALIANRKNPGLGEFRKVAGVEHNMRKAASVEDAIRAPSNESASSIIVEMVDEWAKRTIKTP